MKQIARQAGADLASALCSWSLPLHHMPVHWACRALATDLPEGPR
jgi:hypothetical protein